MLLLSTLVAALPVASALAAFPGDSHLGPSEARVVVRAAEGAVVRVTASAPVRVALAPEGPFLDAPTEVESPRGAGWHGLPGAFEVVLRRDDPRADVTILVADDAGTGIMFDWPAAPRRIPAGPEAALAVALAGLAQARARRR